MSVQDRSEFRKPSEDGIPLSTSLPLMRQPKRCTAAPHMSFDSLGLSDFLLRSLEKLNYSAATPIQGKAIPLILQGRDLLAAAQTGSGKTAAFVLPILQRYADSIQGERSESSLILVPTRELADQVGMAIQRYGQAMPQAPKTLTLLGGLAIDPQIEQAREGCDIIVATPGRLLDLVERQALDLSKIDLLVLDEADRLLALGFADELNAILKLLPAKRQNLLFSATFPQAVVEISDTLLDNPEKIQLEDESKPAGNIVQRVIEVEQGQRTALLRHLLETEGWSRILVFVATKRRAANVTTKLLKRGIRASVLHGDLKQEQRTRALTNFKNGKTQVLMATDLAARGIDISQLPCVVNYDLPRSPTDYVHRIGRTGRASESGVAISFVSAENHRHFQVIEKQHNLNIERERIDGFIPKEWDPDAIPVSTAPVKGKRKSKKDKSREAAARKSRKREAEKREAALQETEPSTSVEPVPPETAPQEKTPTKPVETQNQETAQAKAAEASVNEPAKAEPVNEAPSKPDVSDPWAQSLKKINAPETNPEASER